MATIQKSPQDYCPPGLPDLCETNPPKVVDGEEATPDYTQMVSADLRRWCFYGTPPWKKRWVTGRRWENRVIRVLKKEGCGVFSLAEKSNNPDRDKAPSVETQEGNFVAPDLLVLRGGKAAYYEVKYKSSATYSYTRHRWEISLGTRLVESYRTVEKMGGIPIYLLVALGDEESFLEARLDDLMPSAASWRDQLFFDTSKFRRIPFFIHKIRKNTSPFLPTRCLHGT